MLFNSVDGLTIAYRTDSMAMAIEAHDRNSRLTHSFYIQMPPNNSENLKCSFVYNGSVLWNSLCHEIKVADNVNAFKRMYKDVGAEQVSRLSDGLLPGILLCNCMKLVSLDPRCHHEHVDIFHQEDCTHSECIFGRKYITHFEIHTKDIAMRDCPHPADTRVFVVEDFVEFTL